MKKRINSVISLFLVAIMVLSSASVAGAGFISLFGFSASAAEIIGEGTCGDDATWKIDDEGTLTISGTGAITEYGFYYGLRAPWDQTHYVDKITSVVIEEGITKLEGYLCTVQSSVPDSITSIFLPSTLKSFNEKYFYTLKNLKEITVSPENPYYTCVNNCLISRSDKKIILGCDSSVIPSNGSVVYIGRYAFSNYSGSEIEIPASVYLIDSFAFYGCSQLERVILNEGLTEICYSAFEGCTALSEINLPDSLTFMQNPFPCCDKLDNIIINPETSLYHISGNCLIRTADKRIVKAFDDSIIPDDGSITKIGKAAFESCNSIEQIIIPEGVENIYESAFLNCSSLKEVDMPESLNELGSTAFKKCTSLERVVFRNDATVISADIPASATIVGWENSTALAYATEHGNPFEYICEHPNTTDYEEIAATCTKEGRTAGTKCDDCGRWLLGGETIGLIPHSYKDENATCEMCGKIKVIASGRCGNDAKWVLDALGTLTISGTGAIYQYDYGTITTAAPWNKEIYEDKIISVVIEEGITVFKGGDCFSKHTQSLTSISFPSTIKTIDPYVVYKAQNISSVVVDSANEYYCSVNNCVISKGNGELILGGVDSVIPDDGSVKSIADYAFANLSIKNIEIPGSVTSIGTDAFGNCILLESVTLNEGLIRINDAAFDNCGLEELYIPATVSDIPGYIVCGDKLERIIVSQENPYYHVAGNCLIETKSKKLINGLNNSVIPADGSVTSIGDGAFFDQRKLEQLIIPEGVVSVGRIAFYCCVGLKRVDFPESLNTLGSEVFICCPSLEKVVFNNPDTVILAQLPATTTIVGWENSTAQTYANEHGNPVELVCEHSNLTEYEEIPATCIATGLSYGAQCNDCGRWLVNRTKLDITDHTDADDNGLCDICGFEIIAEIGDCGSNASWTLTKTGTLTISGYGAIKNYSALNAAAGNTVVAKANRNAVVRLVISEGITSVGDYAFYSYTNLKTVDLPSTLEKTGEKAFYGCTSLSRIVIPSGVSEVGYRCFGNSGVSELIFEAASAAKQMTLSEIVYSCPVNSVVIPKSFTSIPKDSFKAKSVGNLTVKNPTCVINGESGIKKITAYPNSEAHKYATANSITFSSLACSHTVTNSVAAVSPTCLEGGYTAGQYCTECLNWASGHKYLEKLGHLDKNADGICDRCLESLRLTGDCGNGVYFTYNILSGELLINYAENRAVADSTLQKGEMKDYSSTDYGIFTGTAYTEYCTEVRSVTIGEGVKTIGSYAFRGFTRLEEAEFKTTVLTRISAGAFSGCTSLGNAVIPEGVKAVGENAFSGCSTLEIVLFPESVTEIGSGALSSCTSLQRVYVMNANTKINTAFGSSPSFATGFEIVAPTGSAAQQYASTLTGVSVRKLCRHSKIRCVLEMCEACKKKYTTGYYGAEFCKDCGKFVFETDAYDSVVFPNKNDEPETAVNDGLCDVCEKKLTEIFNIDDSYILDDGILYVTGVGDVVNGSMASTIIFQMIPRNYSEYISSVRTIVFDETVENVDLSLFTSYTKADTVVFMGCTNIIEKRYKNYPTAIKYIFVMPYAEGEMYIDRNALDYSKIVLCRPDTVATDYFVPTYIYSYEAAGRTMNFERMDKSAEITLTVEALLNFGFIYCSDYAINKIAFDSVKIDTSGFDRDKIRYFYRDTDGKVQEAVLNNGDVLSSLTVEIRDIATDKTLGFDKLSDGTKLVTVVMQSEVLEGGEGSFTAESHGFFETVRRNFAFAIQSIFAFFRSILKRFKK